MIFDGDYVTALVMRWKLTHDDKVLELIIEESNNLIGALVSTYDNIYRDDLIQEASIKLQYAIQFFDPKISTAHTYFTTVIKNACLTFLRKQYKYAEELDIDLQVLGNFDYVKVHEDILPDLIQRNRKRFPSYPSDSIDAITEYIYDELTFGNNKRQIVEDMCTMFDCMRIEAVAIYTSTLMYLRMNYKNYACIRQSQYEDEYSIIPDLEELFGAQLTDALCKVLSGMQVKFP